MIKIKDCNLGIRCDCANDLRKIMVKIPISTYDENLINYEIESKRFIYENCKYNK